MDLEKPNEPGSSPIEGSPPEKILSSGIQLRASARVSKKLKLDQEQALAQAQVLSPDKKNDAPPPVGDEKYVEEKPLEDKPKRVLWTADEKNAFFEALNEHGKNFEAIEKFMTTRAKRRGETGPLSLKSQIQARHFYYRAWHRLSRFVHFPPSVKKMTQELYTLINFGELRKKIGPINEKTSQKLNELIYSGRTQVRVKGKSARIKTPVCRALRRLNNLGEDSEEVRLPAKVEILLTPRNNRDANVALVAEHNPRVRAVLSLDANLSSVISFLSSRWSSSSFSSERGDLWVGPKTDAVINQPHFKCGQPVHSGSVSLMAHVKRVGGDTAELQSLLQQFSKCPKSNRAVRKEKENASVNEDIANTEFFDPTFKEKPGSSLEHPPVIPEDHDSDGKIKDKEPDIKAKEKEVDGKEDFIARAREGWSSDLSNGTKIGQLYMMLGSKGVIELEYWWANKVKCQNELTNVLQRLVSLAKLYQSKPKGECHCGHKCKTGPKSNINELGNKSKTGTKTGANEPGKATKKAHPVNIKRSQANVNLSAVTNPLGGITSGTLDEIGSQPCTIITQQLVNTSVNTSFKHPILPAPLKPSNTSTLESIKQLQSFRPRFCNRRGRSKSRSVVVQRMLPLFPKPPESQPLLVSVHNPSLKTQPLIASVGEAIGVCGVIETVPLDRGTEMPSGPTASSSVDLGLENEVIQEPLPTITLPQDNGNNVESIPTNSFRGILGGGTDSELKNELDDTPPTSPSRILKEGEGQWLNSEVTDFSLSSFLGHLESPLKPHGTNTTDEIPISSDVDAHFQSLMMESSLDYTAKFADLAEKIVQGAEPPNA